MTFYEEVISLIPRYYSDIICFELSGFYAIAVASWGHGKVRKYSVKV